MKPKNENRIMCPSCMRPKLLFETREKAIDHIKWNYHQMLSKKKKGTKVTVYYCQACCGYHLTSHFNPKAKENTRSLINAYNMQFDIDEDNPFSSRIGIVKVKKDKRKQFR